MQLRSHHQQQPSTNSRAYAAQRGLHVRPVGPCHASARHSSDSASRSRQQQQQGGRRKSKAFGSSAAGPADRKGIPPSGSLAGVPSSAQSGFQAGGPSDPSFNLPPQQQQQQQQQPPGADLYIAEPWEIAEPWDVPGLGGQQQQEQQQWGPAPQLEQQHPEQQEQQRRVPLQGAAAAGVGSAGSSTVGDLQDSLDWLLDSDSDDEEEGEGEEGEDGFIDTSVNSGLLDDGWLSDELGVGRDPLQQQQQNQYGGWQQKGRRQQQQRQQPPVNIPHPGDPQQQSVRSVQQQQQEQQELYSSAAPADLQASWEAALAVSLDVLASYDVRYDVIRPPPISSIATRGRTAGSSSQQQGGVGLGPDEVSLTAAAAATARAAGRRRRRGQVPVPPLLQAEQQQPQQQALQAALATAATSTQQQQQQQNQLETIWDPQQQQQQQYLGDHQLQEQLPLPEDARWLAVSRAHASYLSYMQQLAAMVVSKQQQQHQLVYQVGISDAWLQVSHLLSVFGGSELTPPVVAAMWKRLAAIINRKVFVRMSHAERCHYDAFVERLVTQSIITLQHHSISISSSSSGGGPSSSSSSSGISSPVLPAHLAAIAYGMAVLGARSEALAAAVVEASMPLLQPGADTGNTSAAAEAAAAATGSLYTGAAGGSSSSNTSSLSVGSVAPSAAAAAAAGGGVAVWGAGEVASLLWGLGTVGAQLPSSWLQDMQEVSRDLMPRCQPAQLWGVLWGFAKLGYTPDAPWLASWLAAAQQQLDAFDAEGLAHSIWALAAVGHVPHKLWLRAYCGMVAYKIKSFVAGQLAMVLPALSSLGYKPRPELRRTIIAQVRRNLHTYSPSQLVSVLSAVAAYPPGEGEPASASGWQPGRLFLYDVITHSAPGAVMNAWSGRQAAQVLWAFSRFRYVPDRSYLVALTAHLQTQLPLCDADALSMALWALAALQQPLPSESWGAAWCAAALAEAAGFGPQALAHGLAGMAALKVQPSVGLMQSLTLAASGCLSSFSCMELGLMVAAIADLHWRPSDTWMEAFISQVSQQLPAFENEDYGLLLYGLASLAQPLQPTLLSRFCREAQRKLSGLSGEGLGLLIWGLAQYDYEMPDAQRWWDDVFAECSSKWSSAGLRGCALMALGLSQLGPKYAPPGEWESDWVRRYKALVPAKPRSWEELVVGFRAAAGLEAAEPLPACPWLCSVLLQLGKSWNLQGSVQQEGIAGLRVLIGGVNARAAATAALQGGVGGVGVAAAAAAAAVPQIQQGLGGEDVQPMSATAVLL